MFNLVRSNYTDIAIPGSEQVCIDFDEDDGSSFLNHTQ